MDQDLRVGYLLSEFRNYRLEKKLGEGGMGQTWLAAEISGGREVRKVVCKILSERLRGDVRAMEEVRRVFELTQRLNHQNVCPLYGIKSDPEYGDFLVMGYAEGETLADWFQNQPGHENGLSLELILPIILPLAQALDHAHRSGIIHRDIKPSNVIFSNISGRREPWIIDFGIAVRTRNEGQEEREEDTKEKSRENLGDLTTQIHSEISEVCTAEACGTAGTPFYMAPEQIEGRRQTGKTDQYAFASMAYELLSGRMPFQGKNLMELGMQKMKVPPPIPQLSPSVNEALARALSVDPEMRFPSCSDFVHALQSSQKNRSLPILPSAAAAVVLCLAGVFWGTGFFSETESPETVIAETDGMEFETMPVSEDFTVEDLGESLPRKAGDRLILSCAGLEYAFRWCPPGSFRRDGENGTPGYKVDVASGFWILETEVSQGMFFSVMGKNPSLFQHSNHPVENVNWLEAADFCRKLSELLGRKVLLPREKQWEYASRAGMQTEYFFGDSEEELCRYGNYCDASNSDGLDWQDTVHDDGFDKTAPVGSFLPNAWGLHDVHGNVWEWCVEDTSATAGADIPICVFRGGGWGDRADSCRFNSRFVNSPETRHPLLGFRIVLSDE